MSGSYWGKCDLLVVGDGPAGLTAAAELFHAGYTGSRHIFDARSDHWSRVQTEYIDGIHYELAAGRVHSTRHPRVSAWARGLGIGTRPFDYIPSRVNAGGSIASINHCDTYERLSGSLAASQPVDLCWFEYARQSIGSEQTLQLVRDVGLDVLCNPNISAAAGCSILGGNLPETQLICVNPALNEWCTISSGAESLLRRTRMRLRRDWQFWYSYRLQSVQACTSGSSRYTLHFTSGNREWAVDTDAVILAMPLQDSYPACVPIANGLASVDGLVHIPLMKGVLGYEERWWEKQGLAGHCVMTSSSLRRIYFPADGPHIWFYTDSESAWRVRDGVHSQHAGQYLHSELQKALHTEIPTGLRPEIDWRFWENGISFWAQGADHSDALTVEIAPGVFLCSDVLTPFNGWMEGAMMSAQAAVQKLLSNSLSDL
jgi:Flavin containing amine oxidoreductase